MYEFDCVNPNLRDDDLGYMLKAYCVQDYLVVMMLYSAVFLFVDMLKACVVLYSLCFFLSRK